MHDVVFIKYLKSIDKLLEDKQRLFFGNDSIFPEHSFQSAPVAVLVDKIEITGCFEHIDVLNNMLIFFDIGEYIDFVDGTFL